MGSKMDIKFSGSELLNVEYEALKRVKLIVAIFLFLLIGLMFTLLASYTVQRNSLVWGIVTIIYVAYVVHAGDKYKSVFRVFALLDLWEQSLLKRMSDEELKQAYREGSRIFRDGEEVEVIGEYFVPRHR